ncbi:MAG: hypothetical protein U0X39_12225 [Bacteroidales bacterium]
MKQKVIITTAVLALLLAIGLIAVDLFRPKPVNTNIYSTLMMSWKTSED